MTDTSKTKTNNKASTNTVKSAKSTKSGGSAAMTRENKLKAIVIAAICFVLIIALVVGLVVGTKSCRGKGASDPGGIIKVGDVSILPNTDVTGDKPVSKDSEILGSVDPDDSALSGAYTYDYASPSLVGYSAKILGEVPRVKPTVSDEGLESGYPKFGYTLSDVLGTTDDKKAMRNALIAECAYLTTPNTANSGNGAHPYNMMDAQGRLYYLDSDYNITPSLDDNNQQRRLYKHTAAEGMYLGDVDDDEPAIVKEVTIRPRGYNGYSVTGVYAPAGEVITIKISEKDMERTGGLTIHIGQALYNGQANNIWTDKNQMQRMPVILNTMIVNKYTATLDNGYYTAYVGSFLGGPLYIRNTSATYTATISGGVAYSHFILGYTTKEEFEQNAKSSAPYFDLEVWDRGVLHSGPKVYASKYSYDELYKAAVLWDKVSTVTTTGSNQGIVFMYDPFVAAGAAVAFPGRSSVNCPMSWMTDSLNYSGIVTSGSWGNFHEYHHNFQGYGVGNGGEVTNNGLTLVSYALFTKISANRGIGNYGAQGLSGWNCYTSATWALDQTLKIAKPDESPSNGNQGLALYATLLHNFGANNYMTAKVTQSGGQNYTAYMNAWQNVTHNNMLYFFKDILKGSDIDESVVNTDYPMFVPVSCVYQTGRSYTYDGEKKYFQTMRPYVIPFGQSFDIDLSKYSAPGGQYESGSIVIPDGFNYKLKSVTRPSNGTIEVLDNGGVLRYTPDVNDPSMDSGQIVITLEITKTDGAFAVADVDLVLEFELSHESNKMTLERTTYTYDADNMYTDAQTAFTSGYAGYTDKVSIDHTNPTQNCNTDIWFYPDTEANREKYPNVPEHYFVHDNTIEEISGKLYILEKGKYRLYLRGRLNCALYYSTDGGATYKLGGYIKDEVAPNNSHLFRPNDENTYVDLELEADSWLYLKEVLIVQSTPSVSYIGVGLKQWEEPVFTMVEKYYDAEGNEVDGTTAEGYDHSETKYYDYQGKEVSEETASRAELIAPTVTDKAQPYVNAYRNSYVFPTNSDFETDYFYVRSYNYNYVGEREIIDDVTQTYVSDMSNYKPWDTSGVYDITNLFDGDLETGIHTDRSMYVSADTPAIITVDLGKTINANSIILYPNILNNNCRNAFPKTFTIEGSIDGVEFVEMGKWSNAAIPAVSLELTFYDTATYTFRYYRLVVTATHSGTSRLALGEVEFANTLRLTGNGANFVAPSNDSLIFSGDWETKAVQSSFGQAYLGKSGSKINFEFIGTRLAILTNRNYGENFEVYIDGVLCESIDVVEIDGDYGITYITQKLSSGNHTVEIRCTGEACFDSFAVYSEAESR